ncbi:hypothetical protein QTO30_01905 [Yoonia sp. GPGPB17]|uniref:hypothetical protein n=1 Tax=Yoonia sp. GPGPB17 TaxID=3026147 RepID=UPI0030C07847
MRHLMTSFARLLVVLAVAVAMTGSSFAHRGAPADVDDSLLAYVAAGGSLDDLCGQPGFGGGGETCDACRLVDVAVVAANTTVRLSEIAVTLHQRMGAIPALRVAQTANPACPVRAPPVA